MGAKIKYKGVEVSSVGAGESATIHCNGQKLTGDIVVEAKEDTPEWDITSPDAYEITKGGNE